MPGYRDNQPRIASWRGALDDTVLVDGITPTPRLEYLVALADRIAAAASTPYAMPGLASDMRTERVIAYVANVATRYLRPVVTVATEPSGGPVDTSIWAAIDEGGGAGYEIVIPGEGGSQTYPPYDGAVATIQGAEVVEAAPMSAMDRLVPVVPTLGAATVEQLRVTGAAGVGVWPFLVDDLTAV